MATEKKQRERSIHRLFKDDSGEITARASNSTTTVIFKFANGQSCEYDLAKAFGGSLPAPCVARAAAAFGISTSAGNAGNTIESDAAEDIQEAVEGRLEIFENGQWSSDRGGAPRFSVFLEALTAFRAAKGADVSEAKMGEIKQQLAADPELQKRWMGNTQFKPFYAEIQAKKAAERAAKLKTDASASDADASELLQ